MSDGERIARQQATPIVEALVAMFAPHCDWISPGGSYRREKADIGDVEIVAIPKPTLLAHMDELVASGVIAKKIYVDKNGRKSHRWGPKYRAFVFTHDGVSIKFDSFLCDMDSRGHIFELRTGPADKNEWMMSAFHRFNAPFKVQGGYIWSGIQKLHIPDEQAYFDLLGIPFIEPKDRTLDAYQRHIKWGHVWGDVTRFLPASKPVDAENRRKFNPYQDIEGNRAENAKKPPQNAKKGNPKWEWTAPFLCDDGLVWVHVGYGKWEKKPQSDTQALAYLEHYRKLPRSRDAMAFTLNIKLQNWAREERLVTAVRKSLAIIRGVAA